MASIIQAPLPPAPPEIKVILFQLSDINIVLYIATCALHTSICKCDNNVFVPQNLSSFCPDMDALPGLFDPRWDGANWSAKSNFFRRVVIGQSHPYQKMPREKHVLRPVLRPVLTRSLLQESVETIHVCM